MHFAFSRWVDIEFHTKYNEHIYMANPFYLGSARKTERHRKKVVSSHQKRNTVGNTAERERTEREGMSMEKRR
jgi:hypothetical protein